MIRKRIALFSCAALVASGICLNIQNAISDYGISENSLSLLAGPGSNSSSNSNSNSNSNWNSNTNTGPGGGNGGSNRYTKEYQSCPYHIDGIPGLTIIYQLDNGEILPITIGANGHASGYYSGKIECEQGGSESCKTKGCPGLSIYDIIKP